MLDGELYLHGKPLQTLNSIIRNSADSPQKHDIHFVAYDVDITLKNRSNQLKVPFQTRLLILNKLAQIIETMPDSHIKVAPTFAVHSLGELNTTFNQFIA